MKKNKIYFGLVLVFGLLCFTNLSKSDEPKLIDITKAQAGWALSKYVGGYESGSFADAALNHGGAAAGAVVGGLYGMKWGALGGPIGAGVGALVGGL